MSGKHAQTTEHTNGEHTQNTNYASVEIHRITDSDANVLADYGMASAVQPAGHDDSNDAVGKAVGSGNDGTEEDVPNVDKDALASKEKKASDPKKKPSLLSEFLLLVFKIILIVAVVVALFVFIFGFHRVASSGMEPRIRGNDVIFYYRLATSYEQSDVVVINYEGTTMLGRIIASGGDEVDIDDKGLKINGHYQSESHYVKGETTQVEGGVDFPLTVPEGSFFILGDSREDAIDSRIYGCVPEGDIYGTVIVQMRRADF